MKRGNVHMMMALAFVLMLMAAVIVFVCYSGPMVETYANDACSANNAPDSAPDPATNPQKKMVVFQGVTGTAGRHAKAFVVPKAASLLQFDCVSGSGPPECQNVGYGNGRYATMEQCTQVCK